MAKHKDFRHVPKLNGEHLGPNVGKKFKLVGRSRHGKNRVREQGELWEAIGERNEPLARNHAPAPFLLLQSLDGNNHIRWVSLQRDPDFMIEVINEN
jgi:hypothetical protein